MLQFIVKRLFYGLLVIMGVIVLVFFLFNVLPGDPARMILGQRADLASVEAINKDLGRNKPLHYQFFNYLNDISFLSFHNVSNSNDYWYYSVEKYGKGINIIKIGNKALILKKPYFRRSYQSKREVIDIIAEAFPNTAILAIVSMAFSLIIGISVGVISAIKKDGIFDKISLIIASLGMSLPSFFAAILIAWLFAFVLADYTGLSMFGSLYSVDDMGNSEYLDLKNLILPAITLGIRPLAVIIELTRSSMLDVLNQDYIRTARAKGLSEIKIIIKHALRNAMNPVVTAASGWLASLLAGAVFVEYIFDWKGLGVVIVEALEKYDFPILIGVLLFISVILVIINIFVDILYAWLDPRIRLT